MGGTVSAGQNNDELVDNLIESRYIRTKSIERVFRAVDRAHYILSSHQAYAYKDLAWKHGNLHLSAPCVYGAAMEFLALKPGQSFLNIGSGTGYLNTLAGLLLGPHGTNHGIELHKDCVKYAYDRLEEFKQSSGALEEFEFCEPSFISGNCLDLTPDRQYDCVYCGAAVPETHTWFFKQFVRVGGVLVMPYMDHLFCFRRVDEKTWNNKIAFPVSFATLVIPETKEPNSITLPDCEPMSLQGLCRSKVRQILRENIWIEHPELESENRVLPNRQHSDREASDLSRVIIPIFEDADDAMSSSDDENPEERERNRADFIGGARLLLNMEAGAEEPLATMLPMALQIREGGMQLRRSRPVVDWSIDADNSDDSREAADVVSFRIHPTNEAEAIIPSDNDANHNFPPESSSSSSGHNENNNDSNYEQSSGSNEQSSKPTRTQGICHKTKSNSERYSLTSDSEDDEPSAQRKKIQKREKVDSGIVEDGPMTPDDTTSSSFMDPIGSETNDDSDVDISSVVLRETLQRVCNKYKKNSSPDNLGSDDIPTAHYVDAGLFSTYMKEKIQLLPLPTSLKLYMNHNRQF